jgi:Tol biopolymer transport system component
MRKISAILVLILVCQFSYSQNLISKEKAIEIAVKNGLKPGIDAPVAELVNDTVWEVKCLMCDDNNGSNGLIFKVNAITGDIVKNLFFDEYYTKMGHQPFKTNINLQTNIDSLPIKASGNKPYKLANMDKEYENDPIIAPDNKTIAFHYGYKTIGTININGSGFEKICDECSFPQWIDKDWIAYLKDFKFIYKKNINTHEEIQVTANLIGHTKFQISPDFKWIAYMSNEIWYNPKPDSLGRITLHANDYGLELCLQSVDGKKKKFVTKTGEYVNSPCWSANGDSLFFYIDKKAYMVTDLNADSITYSHSTRKNLDKIALSDFRKVVKGVFPLKVNCKVLEIDANSLQPKCILIDKPGRYDNLVLSYDLKYLIYTNRECKDCEPKLWVLKLE